MEARNESPKPGAAEDEPQAADAGGLDAGGHEPAPASEDPEANEARDSIQDAFDNLQAMHPDDALWDEAARRADEEPVTDAAGDSAAPRPAGEPASTDQAGVTSGASSEARGGGS